MRQKALWMLSAVFVAAFVVTGCISVGGESWLNAKTVRGSGDVISEEREIAGVEAVELATIGNLYIEIGDEESLVIEAEDNLLEYIETDVHWGELVIETRNVNLRTRRPINYYLTVKELTAAKISSAGNIEVDDITTEKFTIGISSAGDFRMGRLEADRVRIRVSSAGDTYIDYLTAKSLDVKISSSGNVSIDDGRVDSQNISVSSSGDYRAEDLESREAEVDVSSSGDATVRVSEYLDASASSSGDIKYIGRPRVHANESSSGDIRQISRGRRKSSI